MKNFILISILSLITIPSFSQNCYSVSKVENLTENSDLSSKKFTFGVKQITEELLGEKFTLCENGKPITVNIISIEAPSIGINIGPFMIKKKITEVKTVIIIDGKKYEGFGVAKLSVKAGFAELRDENLPFEKSVFASAIKKSIQNGVEKI
jgi:hypothetical protein